VNANCNVPSINPRYAFKVAKQLYCLKTLIPVLATAVERSVFLSIRCKAKASHTTLVLLNPALTFLLRVTRIGKQHAFVAFGFLVCADAAWLVLRCHGGAEFGIGW